MEVPASGDSLLSCMVEGHGDLLAFQTWPKDVSGHGLARLMSGCPEYIDLTVLPALEARSTLRVGFTDEQKLLKEIWTLDGHGAIDQLQ